MQLRVLTINLWGDSEPLEERMAGLGDYLDRERPDVVGFQEVADKGDPTQAHRLAEMAGYPTVHHVRTGRMHTRGEGLAILTNLEAEPGPTVPLPEGAEDSHPRALQQLDVTTADGLVLRIGNTHLAWPLKAADLRTKQAERIREQLDRWTRAVVLVGDLNDVPGSAPLLTLTDAGLIDCYAAVHRQDRWTFHPDNPYAELPQLLERRVDHILARGFEVLDAAVVLTGADAPVVSDHYGVRATLAVAGGPSHR